MNLLCPGQTRAGSFHETALLEDGLRTVICARRRVPLYLRLRKLRFSRQNQESKYGSPGVFAPRFQL